MITVEFCGQIEKIEPYTTSIKNTQGDFVNGAKYIIKSTDSLNLSDNKLIIITFNRAFVNIPVEGLWIYDRCFGSVTKDGYIRVNLTHPLFFKTKEQTSEFLLNMAKERLSHK